MACRTLGILLLWAAGCGPVEEARVEPVPAAPCIVVHHDDSPAQGFVETGTVAPMNMGVVEPGGEAARNLRIENRCRGVLELSALEIEGSPAFSGISSGTMIPEGVIVTLSVGFLPPAADTYQAELVVRSNDPNHPGVRVPLFGQCGGPELEVTPLTWDYGAHYIGCEVAQPITLRNVGLGQVTVSGVELFTASVDEYALDLDPLTHGPLPFVLEAYDEQRNGPQVEVFLDYEPLDTFEDDVFIEVRSDDPARPTIAVKATGTGTAYGNQTDRFDAPAEPEVDVLFVVGRGSIMDDVHDDLVEAFGAFYEDLEARGFDHHTAAVVGNGGCVIGPDPYIGADVSAAEAQGALRTMLDSGGDAVPITGSELAGHELMAAALGASAIGTGGCNEAFYREDAKIVVVYLSKVQDSSSSSWSSYVAQLNDLKADPDDIVVHAGAGEYPSGCEDAEAGNGFYEATVATGGTFFSICGTDWDAALADVARSGASTRSITLTQEPIPETIEVKVDGVRVSVGWAYEVSTRSVVFDREYLPPGGSRIEVYYERLPDCER